MASTFSVRLDAESERKFAALRTEGQSRSAVIAHAVDIAYATQVQEQLRRESAALLHDDTDRAEVLAAREAMGAGDAW
ncbi:MAG: hypothetical protein ACRDTA_02510 [Pseudonocardiaceae bacterium]